MYWSDLDATYASPTSGLGSRHWHGNAPGMPQDGHWLKEAFFISSSPVTVGSAGSECIIERRSSYGWSNSGLRSVPNACSSLGTPTAPDLAPLASCTLLLLSASGPGPSGIGWVCGSPASAATVGCMSTSSEREAVRCPWLPGFQGTLIISGTRVAVSKRAGAYTHTDSAIGSASF